MVSPSNRKKDHKERELNGNLGRVRNKTGSKKTSKSIKPLASKKFYLDLKNNSTLQKLETKLKSLGAIIEQFLVKEVNYVVTDRKEGQVSDSNTASCSTPPTPSPSPTPSFAVSSPLDGFSQKKSKSRAEAMLERVRLQPQCVKVDPLDNARAWNIPIYSLQEILLKLKKISDSGASSSKSVQGLKLLRGCYLKLETGGRPEFRQFRDWPKLNLDCARSESPFSPVQDGRETVRKAARDGSERLAGGHCEMCRVDFLDIKAHVLTSQHLNFAHTSANYAQLDTIIKSKTVDTFLASQICASLAGESRRCLRSTSVESQSNSMGSRSSSMSNTNGHMALRTRASTRSLDDSKPLEVQCNGNVTHNHMTRSAVKSDSILECLGSTQRARTISASCPETINEYSQLSPTGSDTTHHLRSRKQMWLPNSLIGTTAEDALSNTRLRSSRDYSTSEILKSPSGKTPLKSPFIPAANDLSEKLNRSNGKTDCVENKVNLFHSTTSPSRKNFEISRETQEDYDESNSETSNDIGDKSYEKNKEKGDCNKQSTRKYKAKTTCSKVAKNINKRKKVQKKRLSVEEKLIEDNKSYYKVEVLNSKLRSTGYYITQSQREMEIMKSNGNDGATPNNAESVKSEIKTEDKEPVVVRFKKVRQTELSLLSDEAESFMFGEPRRDTSVSNETSEEEDESLSKFQSEKQDHIVTKIKKEVLDESSIGSCSISSGSTSLKRKRKTHDESFLQDNLEYYKFECTGSRLRFSQNPLIDSTQATEELTLKTEMSPESKNCDSLDVKLDQSNFHPEYEIKGDIPMIDDNLRPRYEDLKFSFESAPEHEPWYQTFTRQDTCEEYYYPTHSTYPTILLPYEYPNSLLKKIKIAATKEKVKKRKMKDTKVQQLIVDDKPRKSPRCHASTLAIMSSLKRRRPRDSPEKKSEPPVAQSACQNEEMQDEESRCSTLLDAPSYTESLPMPQTPLPDIPEIKIDVRPDGAQHLEKTEADLKEAEENIGKLFTEITCKNEDDLIAQMLFAIKKEVESSPGKDSHKKGKAKAKAAKTESSIAVFGGSMCLPVDPSILDGDIAEQGSVNIPGPAMDIMSLIDGYRSCTSIERADYEHLHPTTVDALSLLIAESCNSSDCGGSSACDYSFLENGKVVRKKKRKKRNLTGWPANQKKRCNRKGEELSTTVLKRNCKVKGILELAKVSGNDCATEKDSVAVGENTTVGNILTVVDSATVVDSVTLEDRVSVGDNNTGDNSVSDVVSETNMKPICVAQDDRLDTKVDNKKCNTISRTSSIDSSVEVQSCYIKVDKMSENAFSRHLRSSGINRLTNSSTRRSSRTAKLIGRESLKRFR